MIEIKNLSKTFSSADGTVEALKEVSFVVERGAEIYVDFIKFEERINTSQQFYPQSNENN